MASGAPPVWACAAQVAVPTGDSAAHAGCGGSITAPPSGSILKRGSCRHVRQCAQRTRKFPRIGLASAAPKGLSKPTADRLAARCVVLVVREESESVSSNANAIIVVVVAVIVAANAVALGGAAIRRLELRLVNRLVNRLVKY